MFTFFIVILVIIAAVIASILPSLFSKARVETLAEGSERDAVNIQIARDRLLEISQIKEQSSQEYKQAEQELEVALLDDLGQPVGTEPRAVRRSSRATNIIIILLIPIASIGLYAMIGSPELIDQRSVPHSSQNVAPNAASEQDITILLAQLEEKIAENPDNPDGWSLAANTYMAMGNYPKARYAYEKLHGLVDESADLLAAWADAIILDNQNTYVDEAQQRIERALELDPKHINSLWIAALGNQSIGHHKETVAYLKTLLPIMDGDVEAQEQIRGVMAVSLTQAGGSSDVESSVAQDSPTQSVAPEQPAKLLSISTSVVVSEALSEMIQPSDTVFIMAKATSGPPIPLAVNRQTVSQFPLSASLDDSMSMLPTHKISNVDEVNVSARISKSGEAIRQPGDLISGEVLIQVGDTGVVNLVIDRIVE